ncbi:MAG: hypothetical protein LW600_05580 [Ilumatobacteraceae bacterium]|jgi:hypothetical protein|nr:hypothetical protein [Ilumatobacteraceae bacterium]
MSILRQLVDRTRSVVSRILSPRVRNALKAIWMVLVTVFVARYMVRNWDSITDTVQSFSALVLLGTVAVTIIGKVVISVHSQLITKVNGREFTFRESFWMYSASDLVKYIPGGLWNALARVRLYTGMGMSATDSTKAFALEKYWMVLGALATGSLALTPDGLEALSLSTSATTVVLTRLAIVALWVVATWLGGRLTGNVITPLSVLRSLSEQVIMAVFFGLGVWIPLEAVDAGIGPVVAIGAFSLGRGLGYLAVFAPAGIGVREVVTLWALGGTTGPQDAIVIALAVNRVMTFIADLGSFGLSLAVKPRTNSTQ